MHFCNYYFVSLIWFDIGYKFLNITNPFIINDNVGFYNRGERFIFVMVMFLAWYGLTLAMSA